MTKAKPIGYLVSMLITQLKYMVFTAFAHLGLCKSAEEAIYAGELPATTTSNEDNNHVLMWDGSSPSLVPVPIPTLTAFIHKTLPVVLLSSFLEGVEEESIRGMNQYKDLDDDDEEEEEGKLGCSVCLDGIERSHQIRQLSNCCHVFHRECLDRWVDEGHATCPLCRSMLLPANINPWVVLRS